MVTDNDDSDTKDNYTLWPRRRVSTFAAENAEEEELDDDHVTYLSHHNNKRQYEVVML